MTTNTVPVSTSPSSSPSSHPPTTPPAPPKPISLAHIFLQTSPSRFPALVAWYKAFLPATATHETDRLAFLTYDREHHRVAIGALPGVREGGRDGAGAGMRHVAFAHASLRDLADAYVARRAAGALPERCVNHGMTTSMYYRDPDGGGVEVQVDNFDTAEEAKAYMRTEAFAANPLGADFDPEELVRRLEAGESEQDIKRMVDAGPRDAFSVLP
ncbi:putative FAD-binding protein [Neofusicoccum parvum]|nr:putative FAD-binding protein [Neofusicoccum parvum]